MLPVIFHYIFPSCFRGDDFYQSTNQKQELHIAMMFLSGSGRNEQSFQRTFQRCFQQSFDSFGQEELEDTEVAMRNRISKKNRQHNGQKKKYKQRSTKHTYKYKDRVTGTPLQTGGELRCSGRVRSSCSASGTRRINLVTNPVISRE